MKIAGIDLAWQAEKNTSAVAFGSLAGNSLKLTSLYPDILGLDQINSLIEEEGDVSGIAIDASLIINNRTGQRDCEKLLSKTYANRKAGCHASNLTLYPDPCSVRLSKGFDRLGFKHLQRPDQGKWQIECYPHPAIIEVFGLLERLLYKKGNVTEKQQGQVCLANHIKSLDKSDVLALEINADKQGLFDSETIYALKGKVLKQNEDALDSIICLYICGLYAFSVKHKIFGSVDDGYIYVPRQKCI